MGSSSLKSFCTEPTDRLALINYLIEFSSSFFFVYALVFTVVGWVLDLLSSIFTELDFITKSPISTDREKKADWSTPGRSTSDVIDLETTSASKSVALTIFLESVWLSWSWAYFGIRFCRIVIWLSLSPRLNISCILLAIKSLFVASERFWIESKAHLKIVSTTVFRVFVDLVASILVKIWSKVGSSWLRLICWSQSTYKGSVLI